MSLENITQNIPPEVLQVSEVVYEFSGLAFGMLTATGFLMKNKKLGSVLGVAGALGLVGKTALDVYEFVSLGNFNLSNLVGDAGGLMIALLSIRHAMRQHTN